MREKIEAYKKQIEQLEEQQNVLFHQALGMMGVKPESAESNVLFDYFFNDCCTPQLTRWLNNLK